MNTEEKQLVLIDICARLPYGVKCRIFYTESEIVKYGMSYIDVELSENIDKWILNNKNSISNIKPYLRPMSSMTEEEINEFILISDTVLWLGDKRSTCILSLEQMDWLNKNMFDHRGLIPIGLALEAKEGMYKNK